MPPTSTCPVVLVGEAAAKVSAKPVSQMVGRAAQGASMAKAMVVKGRAIDAKARAPSMPGFGDTFG